MNQIAGKSFDDMTEKELFEFERSVQEGIKKGTATVKQLFELEATEKLLKKFACLKDREPNPPTA